MFKHPSISIILPVLNEAEVLPSTVKMLSAHLKTCFSDFEIILVESGSTDASLAVCKRLANENGHVRLIEEGRRNGFGSALKLGLKHSSKTLVSLYTADQPFPVEYFARAASEIADADAVFSFREVDSRSFYRRTQSFVFNIITRSIFSLPLKHVNSALKLFRRECLVNLDLQENGWLIDTEITAKLLKKGVRFKILPVPLYERKTGRSSITFLTGFKILFRMPGLLKNIRNFSVS